MNKPKQPEYANASVDQDSPNSNPSRQLKIVAGHLNDGLRVALSMQEAGPLSSCASSTKQISIARAAGLHLLEAINHLEQGGERTAVQASYDEVVRLLNISEKNL